jgi:lincosamide nucleotidyltransferase A/C/D/E
VISAADVLQILDTLTVASVKTWLDGGWAVDAVVGKQTRPHDDLDLVVALEDSELILVEDERPTRFVLRDSLDRRIDLHTVTFDAAGSGIQVLQDGTPWTYLAHGFAGRGRIQGRELPCLTVEVQILCHAGYEPDETDLHDLGLLRSLLYAGH